MQIADRLRAEGVYIRLLQPQIVFDDSPMGKAMYAMFGMFAEMERALVRERTRAGLAAARARGRSGGRKPKLNDKQVREIKALLRDPDISVRCCAPLWRVTHHAL